MPEFFIAVLATAGLYLFYRLRKIARKLEITEKALMNAREELEHFAYVASHDLKAPLRHIDNLASWIIEDAKGILPVPIVEKLDLLRERTARMGNLLNDILSYSRAGRITGQPELVDIGALLAYTVPIHANDKFVIKAENMPVIVSDRSPLEQVFGNLLANAVRHHDKDAGTIRITAQQKGDFYEFSVRDDGPGIAPEYHERAFEMFQTLQSRDKVEGSGLGLSIVKKLVEGQGGRVWIESTGRGTTVRFLWLKAPKAPGA